MTGIGNAGFETEARIIVPVGQYRAVPGWRAGWPKIAVSASGRWMIAARCLPFPVFKDERAVRAARLGLYGAVVRGGQQASVYPSDSMPYAVCVKLRFVCHEGASFVVRCLIRIYDTCKWDFASFFVSGRYF